MVAVKRRCGGTQDHNGLRPRYAKATITSMPGTDDASRAMRKQSHRGRYQTLNGGVEVDLIHAGIVQFAGHSELAIVMAMP